MHVHVTPWSLWAWILVFRCSMIQAPCSSLADSAASGTEFSELGQHAQPSLLRAPPGLAPEEEEEEANSSLRAGDQLLDPCNAANACCHDAPLVTSIVIFMAIVSLG